MENEIDIEYFKNVTNSTQLLRKLYKRGACDKHVITHKDESPYVSEVANHTMELEKFGFVRTVYYHATTRNSIEHWHWAASKITITGKSFIENKISERRRHTVTLVIAITSAIIGTLAYLKAR